MCGADVLLEACFSCKITERILPTSFDGVLPVLGLKSQSFATRSHSVPGEISWVVERNSCSALSEAERLAACIFVSYNKSKNRKYGMIPAKRNKNIFACSKIIVRTEFYLLSMLLVPIV